MNDLSNRGPFGMYVMMFFIMAASALGPELLFAQTAIASVDDQSGSNSTTATSGTDTNTTAATPSDNSTHAVAVGGGNITYSINQFSPQTTEIQAGESVTFFAPSGSTEVHNIIFDSSNGTVISNVGVPFVLPSDTIGEVPTTVSEALTPAPPYNLGEPIIQGISNSTAGTQTIVGFNKIAYFPSVVDQNGNVRYLDEQELGSQMLQIGEALAQGTPMPTSLSTSYTMDGTETIVSSGIILDVNGLTATEGVFLDEGGASQAAENNQGPTNNSATTTTSASSDEGTTAQQEENATEGPEPTPGEVFPPATEGSQSTTTTSELIPPAQFPYLGSFTVKFNEPGTYDYSCAFHPGMIGQVIVGSGGEGGTNQTSTVAAP